MSKNSVDSKNLNLAPNKVESNNNQLSGANLLIQRFKRKIYKAAFGAVLAFGLSNKSQEEVYNYVGTDSDSVAAYIDSEEVRNRTRWSELLDRAAERDFEQALQSAQLNSEIEAEQQRVETERAALETQLNERIAQIDSLNLVQLNVQNFITELNTAQSNEDLQDWRERIENYLGSMPEMFIELKNELATHLVNAINNSTGQFQDVLKDLLRVIVTAENQIQMIKLDLESSLSSSRNELQRLRNEYNDLVELYDYTKAFVNDLKANTIVLIDTLLYGLIFMIYAYIGYRLASISEKFILARGIPASNSELTSAYKNLDESMSDRYNQLEHEFAISREALKSQSSRIAELESIIKRLNPDVDTTPTTETTPVAVSESTSVRYPVRRISNEIELDVKDLIPVMPSFQKTTDTEARETNRKDVDSKRITQPLPGITQSVQSFPTETIPADELAADPSDEEIDFAKWEAIVDGIK